MDEHDLAVREIRGYAWRHYKSQDQVWTPHDVLISAAQEYFVDEICRLIDQTPECEVWFIVDMYERRIMSERPRHDHTRRILEVGIDVCRDIRTLI